VFPQRGFLLTNGVDARVAVVVTQDKSWNELPFIYRAMIGDAAIASSQAVDESLVQAEQELFDKARSSGVSLVSFKPEDASRATQQWISEQPANLRGSYSLVHEYVKNAGSQSPVIGTPPHRNGQAGKLHFATTRDETHSRSILYHFGDARTDLAKCGQIEFSGDLSVNTAAFVGSLTADTQSCGAILNSVLQSSGRMLIYVHGFNNRFSDAAERAILLKNELGADTEVVLWSWPSKRDGLAGNYNYDKESVTGAAQHQLITILRALEPGSATRPLSLLAHSMGGWHVLGVLRTLSEAGRWPDFHELVMAAPDVPDNEFRFAL